MTTPAPRLLAAAVALLGAGCAGTPSQDAALPAGCAWVSGERAVSIQARTLYEIITGPSMTRLLAPPVSKSFQSVECGRDSGTIYYYEYADAQALEKARGFVEGLVWGGSGPTPLHPELILTRQNTLVVVSSRTPERFAQLVRGATAAAPAAAAAGTGGQPLGAGLYAAFPAPFEFRSYPMPEGATNHRVFGKTLRIGITGIPTGKPRETEAVVLQRTDEAIGRLALQEGLLAAKARALSGADFNGGHASICSPDPGRKLAVFANASFACSTTAILSADTMVFIVSIGSESVDSAEYRAALDALQAIRKP